MIPYTSTCTADAKITSWTATRKKCQEASTSRMLGQPRTTPWTRHVNAITSSHTLLLLYHMHYYYSTTCTDIISSHALLLLSYMHSYYLIPRTALTSSHALILIHHMYYDYFITCTAITSSHTLLLLHHMYPYYSTTGTVITPSHALLLLPLFHMHCDAGGNRTHGAAFGFSSTQKEKEKRRTPVSKVSSLLRMRHQSHQSLTTPPSV